MPFSSGKTIQAQCATGQVKHTVIKGDTCWDISSKYKMSLQQLETMNGEVDCDKLKVGTTMCVIGERGVGREDQVDDMIRT